MSRRERRQNNREKQKANSKKEKFEPLSKGARISLIVFSLTVILSFLYLALQDNSIPYNQLETISVTLGKAPEYDEYKIKSTTYRDIILTAKEYQREFKITARTYKATDHDAFKSSVFAGDKVDIKVKKSELDDLNNNTFWNNYNEVYGLSKNGISFIDIDLRTELTDQDSKWSYFFVIIGMVMLPYGFIKGKPLISLNKAITIVATIGLVILLIISQL